MHILRQHDHHYQYKTNFCEKEIINHLFDNLLGVHLATVCVLPIWMRHARDPTQTLHIADWDKINSRQPRNFSSA